jgi:hypothetical protein
MSAYEAPGGITNCGVPSAFCAGGRRVAFARGLRFALAGSGAGAAGDFLAMVDS